MIMATIRLATPRPTTISGLSGNATAVAVSTIGLIAGAASRNARAAAGRHAAADQRAGDRDGPAFAAGQDHPGRGGDGHGQRRMPGQGPGPERRRHEDGDHRGEHDAEDEERYGLDHDRDENRRPGLQAWAGDRVGHRLAEDDQQDQDGRKNLDRTDPIAETPPRGSGLLRWDRIRCTARGVGRLVPAGGLRRHIGHGSDCGRFARRTPGRLSCKSQPLSTDRGGVVRRNPPRRRYERKG